MANEDLIQGAIAAVNDGQSLRKASEQWGVPFSTLRHRLVNHTQPKGQYEAKVMQKLSPHQESHLVNWVLTQEALGLPVSHAQIQTFANRILHASGSQHLVGKHWMQKLIRRYPVLKTKKKKRMDIKRLEGTSIDVLKEWFHLLAIPEISKIQPQDRWNMDETGLMEGLGINGLCVGSSATKVALAKHPESRIWTTIVECISASGASLPPLVIFKGKDVQQQWFPDDDGALDFLRTWRFTTSENGWTSNAIALEWLTKVFIPSTTTTAPRLLVVDGHGSHETDDFMWHCYINNIHLLFLPAHASHVLQPLDVAVFSPLKAAYRRQIANLAVMTDCAPIGKRLFLAAYAVARKEGLTERNIRSGWKASGLWPVNLSKPVMSPLLLKEASQPGSQPASQPATQPASQPVSQSASQRANRQAFRQAIKKVTTPSRSQEIHNLVASNKAIRGLTAVDPIARLLFQKVGKSLDNKVVKLAGQEQKIRALEAEVDRLRPRKKKKVRLDPNERFAGIEQIMEAKRELGRQLEASDMANNYVFEEMCLEWSIFDPAVDS